MDFSDHARVAMRYAVEFAKAFQAEILLCHVLQPIDLISQLPPTGDAYFPPQLAELQEKHARVEAEKVLHEAGYQNSRLVMRTGNPFYEIVMAAREESADLIVIGTHGRGMIAHVLLGSVAEKIVRKAPCPVLTVREGVHQFVMP
jgi:nucleotide-binding universal stress UspA family protein